MSAARPRRRVLPYVLGTILVGVAGALAHRGWGFYGLSLEQQVEHPDFRSLRASGRVGLGYGFVALALVFANLAYLVRRHLASARLGSMRVWLDLHVFTGLVAAVLVTCHSALQLRTPIHVASAASLAVVVVTGVLGRFLHMMAPTGDAARLRHALEAVDGVLPAHRAPLETALAALPAPRIAPDASLVGSLLAVPTWRRIARARREALALLVPPRHEQSAAQRSALRELHAASDADARAAGVTALLRSWRGLHRFFALLMLLTVGLHAGVAWHYGYRWIFT